MVEKCGREIVHELRTGSRNKIKLVGQGVAELFGRLAGGLLEGDAKAIGALVAAHVGEDFEFVIGISKEAFRALDANALQFLPGRAADVIEEGFVQSAAGHGGDADQIFDADRLAGVFPNKTEAIGDAFVFDGEEVAALAGDNAHGRDADGFFRGGFAVHQIFEHHSASVTEHFEIGIHAGNGRVDGVGREEIIFRADDGDLLRDIEAGAFAGFQDFQSLLVICGKNGERTGGRL